MEVDSVLAHDVVFCAWIWEIVDLDIVLDAFSDKAETVLPYDYRVYCSLTDQELSFEGIDLANAYYYILDQERLLSWAPDAKVIPNNAVILIEY